MIRPLPAPLVLAPASAVADHRAQPSDAQAKPADTSPPPLEAVFDISTRRDMHRWRDDLMPLCTEHREFATSLRLFLNGVSLTEIAEFRGSGAQRLAEVLDAEPELADGIVASWENALARKPPGQSLNELCERITSPSHLRDLRRSMERLALYASTPEIVEHDTPAPAKGWVQRFSDTFRWLMLAGSGSSGTLTEVDYERRARELAETATRHAPALNFRQHGLLSTLTGLLYAHASLAPTVHEIARASCMPAPSRPPSSSGSGESFRDVIGQTIDACLLAIRDGASSVADGILRYDPLRFPVVAADVPAPADHTNDRQDTGAMHRTSHHRVRHARRHLGHRSAPSTLTPLDHSPTVHRAIQLANALRSVDRIQEDAREGVAPTLDLHRFVRAELVDAIGNTTKQGDPDHLFLNRFKNPRNVSDLVIPSGKHARTDLIESFTLSEAGVRFLTGQRKILETHSEYGIYARNQTQGDFYLPEDVFPSMSVTRFLKAALTFEHQWFIALERLEHPQPDAPEMDARYQRTSTLLEACAAVEYNAGRLSADGLVLAQIAAFAPDAALRTSEHNTFLGNIKGRTITVDVAGFGYYRPAGVFAVSEDPVHMTQNPGRILVVVQGSPVPLREYPSEESLERDLARGVESDLYCELTIRLPLHVQAGCLGDSRCRVTIGETQADLIETARTTSFLVVRRDFSHSSHRLLATDRSAEWTAWFAGAMDWDSSAGVKNATLDTPVLADAQTMHITRDDISLLDQLGQVRMEVAASLPDVYRGAHDYMAELITDLSGQSVSPSTTYLHVYRNRTDATGIPPQVHYVLDPIESSSLTQRLADMASGETSDALEADVILRFSKDSAPEGARELTIPGLTPERLLRAIDVEVFVSHQSNLFTIFWREHTKDLYASIKGAFVVETFLQARSKRLPEWAAEIARKVAGLSNKRSLGLQSMNQPTTPGSDIRMFWLYVGSAQSDIQVFSDASKPGLLVYAPRILPDQLVALDHDEALARWVNRMIRDPRTRPLLVDSFRNSDRRDAASKGLLPITSPKPNASARPAVSRVSFDGDPFTAYLKAFRVRAEEEALDHLHDKPFSVIAPLLNVLAAANFVMGIATIAGAPVPGLALGTLLLSTISFGFGATATAFGEADTRRAGLNAMVFGLTGMPVSWFMSAGLASRVRLEPFLNALPLQRLQQLMPNLYRGERGMVAQSGEHYFNVEYLPLRGGWRMTNPGDDRLVGPLVSQRDDYDWVIDEVSTSGVSEVSVDPRAVFHEDVSRAFVDVEYRSKLTAQRNAASAAHKSAFEAGRSEAEQSPLLRSKDARPAALLKLDFIDPGNQDAKLLGILSRRIDEAERIEAAALATKNANFIASEIQAIGGEFHPLAQAAYISSNADGRTGFCLPLVRALAVAQQQARTTQFIELVQRAIKLPQAKEALDLRNVLIKLHSNVDATASETPLGLFTIDGLKDVIENGPSYATYLISTRAHAMSISVDEAAVDFYDPTFGICGFTSIDDAFTVFRNLMHRGDLARRYGAFDTAGELQFSVKRLDVMKLANVDVGNKPLYKLIAPDATSAGDK
ncbi:Toxin Afp18 [Pandoraea aquatica]|uniref:Toxin Afp18 n=1 Tax=Pandoraea aquatica TaxID=2508290 RepID=A0A5E4WJU6_9BURK|nr:DUF6543 domain-containing protein [Pandoraea aquatica]VVE23265.1 Toxin Afp18 [Pandoraea aquatica]